MPHMKYFQTIGRIKDTFETLYLFHYENPSGISSMALGVYDLTLEDESLIREEIAVLDYIMGCQIGFARGEHNIPKPIYQAVERCFNRHIRHLNRVFDIYEDNVNQHPLEHIQKQFKACHHYLFQFNLPGWVDSLPDEILTFENLHPNHLDLENEDTIEIPKI